VTPHPDGALKSASEHTRGKAAAKKPVTGRDDDIRALTRRLFTSQEEERRRIARQLHDDVSQRLAAIEIDGDQLEANLPPGASEAKRAIRRLRRRITKLSEDVQRMSQLLYPSIIEDLGLEAALQSLTEEFGARENTVATFSSRDVPADIPLDAAIGLYRITQETLRNVSTDAGRTRAQVSLRGSAGSIQLQIAVSGAGFDLNAEQPGLGLLSMKERARHIGATFHIHSTQADGTRVTMKLPVRAAR
jgi:signal transduction histidine kinase